MGERFEQLINQKGISPRGPIAKWLQSNVANYLEAKQGSPKAREAEAQLPHVVDYLKVVTDPNAKVPRGIKSITPGRLGRISVPDAIAGADRWVKALNKQTVSHVDKDGEEHVMDVGDGFRLVKVVSDSAKSYEGKEMGHCVGGGSYAKEQIYSLRDEHNKPHATFQIKDGAVVQCKGKENKTVIDKYIPYVQTAVKVMGWGIESDQKSIWLIKQGGQYHDPRDLPEEFEMNGTLDLSEYKGPLSLPNRLRVDGDLDLSCCTRLTTLPEGLVVTGSVYLNGCTALTSLPKKLQIEKDFYLNSCVRLRNLPEALELGGSLGLFDCCALTMLPEGLIVGKNLWLSGCRGLRTLPKRLRVGGHLSLRDCMGLTRLPEDLKVGWDLVLSGCTGLLSLPSTILVEKMFGLSPETIRELQSNRAIDI